MPCPVDAVAGFEPTPLSSTTSSSDSSSTVTATDADNDALAYFWDFGDGGISTDNLPVQTHSFASGGEYAVQVTVSDMKGGTSRDTVLVKVDAPTVYRIAGRVLDGDNKPLAGIKMSAVNGSAL